MNEKELEQIEKLIKYQKSLPQKFQTAANEIFLANLQGMKNAQLWRARQKQKIEQNNE